MNELLKEGDYRDEGAPVYFNYKDRAFRMLFKEKERLLELYNALNGTDFVWVLLLCCGDTPEPGNYGTAGGSK